MFTTTIFLENRTEPLLGHFKNPHLMYERMFQKLRIFYKNQMNKQFYNFYIATTTHIPYLLFYSIPFQRRKINNVPLV